MDNQHPTELWQATFSTTFQKNARNFWNHQAAILDQMREFSEGWFERRRIGTKAALEACDSLCCAKAPHEWFGAYQQWSTGAIQRLAADSLLFQAGIGKIVEDATANMPSLNVHEQSDVSQPVSESRLAEAA